MTRSLPMAALMLVTALSACAGGTEDSTAGSSAAASSRAAAASSAAASSASAAAPTEEPTASATEEPPASATPIAETEHEFDWTVSFSIMAPGDWEAAGAEESIATETGLDVTSGERIVMSVLVKEDETPEQIVDRMAGIGALDMTDAQPTDVGGALGYVFDLQVNEEAPLCPYYGKACVAIHNEPGANWYWDVIEGRTMRVWVVDLSGQTVLVTSDAREDRFEDWIAELEEYLATLEWQES